MGLTERYFYFITKQAGIPFTKLNQKLIDDRNLTKRKENLEAELTKQGIEWCPPDDKFVHDAIEDGLYVTNFERVDWEPPIFRKAWW